jgi:hypothetical protein
LFRKQLLFAAMSVAIVGLAGCGDNPLGRRALSGSVTLDGSPLESGNIEFAPLDAASVSSGANIQQGRFDVPELQGVPPGKYRVRIFAAQAAGAPRTPEEAAIPTGHRPGESLVAARFNTASELVAEVTESGRNEFNFEVSSQSP